VGKTVLVARKERSCAAFEVRDVGLEIEDMVNEEMVERETEVVGETGNQMRLTGSRCSDSRQI